jgi:cytochrome c oxidase subunit 3
MEPLRERPVLDVSGLPSVVFGKSNTTWLANVLYMMIEGTMFALLFASYFYLRTRTDSWPPVQDPPLLTYGELANMNCRWYDNAYGSIMWSLIGLHTGHLITEFIETLSILGIAFTPKMEGTRLADVAINSDYWYFVVGTAVLMDFIIYGTTRFL